MKVKYFILLTVGIFLQFLSLFFYANSRFLEGNIVMYGGIFTTFFGVLRSIEGLHDMRHEHVNKSDKESS